MTPSEELRAAAARLRAVAAKTTKPRKAEYGWDFLAHDEVVFPDQGTQVVCSQHGGTEMVADNVRWEDAAWIALMAPDKAEPLAVWLEGAARLAQFDYNMEGERASEDILGVCEQNALAFARAINGGAE